MKKISKKLKIDYINKLNEILSIKNFNTMGTPEKIKLYNRLRRLECRIHRINLDLCNGVINQSDFDAGHDAALKTLQSIFTNISSIEIGGDPRGYSLRVIDTVFLKLQQTAPVVMDWGGCGLIAPAPVDLQETIENLGY